MDKDIEPPAGSEETTMDRRSLIRGVASAGIVSITGAWIAENANGSTREDVASASVGSSETLVCTCDCTGGCAGNCICTVCPCVLCAPVPCAVETGESASIRLVDQVTDQGADKIDTRDMEKRGEYQNLQIGDRNAPEGGGLNNGLDQESVMESESGWVVSTERTSGIL